MTSNICKIIKYTIICNANNGGINYVESTQNISQTVFGSSCTIISKAINEPAAGEPNPTTTLIVTGLTYGATFATTIDVGFVDES